MSSVDPPPISLHARVASRSVTLTGNDAEERERTTKRIAALLDDPPALLLTGSCSAALDASATLLGLAPGDEVIAPAYTFPTSVSPFVARGARIRFVDVDPATGNPTPDQIGSVVSDRTRAVVLTHYAGLAADLDAVERLLEPTGAELVEDAAHGLFGAFAGRALGRVGRFGCLSFHRTKNVSALDGGALVVNDEADVAAALVAIDKGTDRVRFDRGEVRSYEWSGLGSAWRMGEASLRYLAAELDEADRMQQRRLEVWASYRAGLGGWAADHGVGLPVETSQQRGPAHLYFLVLPGVDDRDGFVAHCAARGVQAARHFGSLPESAFGQTLVAPDEQFPGAARLHRCLVRIPLHHELDEGDVARVIDAVTSWRSA